ncbi:hypothetical protein AHiyo4_21730 [Arthrobacter sp. Hiyo4]|nr:hypothetical protein AHiyo4_21730 [Arthrobacter sp. Hiyo4]
MAPRTWTDPLTGDSTPRGRPPKIISKALTNNSDSPKVTSSGRSCPASEVSRLSSIVWTSHPNPNISGMVRATAT